MGKAKKKVTNWAKDNKALCRRSPKSLMKVSGK